MRLLLISLFPLLFISCERSSTSVVATNETDTLRVVANEVVTASGPDTEYDIDSDYATFYILVADTGNDYYILHQEMTGLQQKLNLNIDTMNRYYNAEKGIILHEDDEDDMYAGEYFPRRFPSTDLSLEYLSAYMPYVPDTGQNKTIALIAGIFQEEKEGTLALQQVKPHLSSATLIKASMYVGCMH
jgi:hypothetical protein